MIIKIKLIQTSIKAELTQGVEGVLRDPGFGRNRVRDSGIQKKSNSDS